MQGGRSVAPGRAAIPRAYASSQGGLYLSAWDYSTQCHVGFIIGGSALWADDADVGRLVLTRRRIGDHGFIHSDLGSAGGCGG